MLKFLSKNKRRFESFGDNRHPSTLLISQFRAQQFGFRSGNWLTVEQSSQVLGLAAGPSLRAKRDYAAGIILVLVAALPLDRAVDAVTRPYVSGRLLTPNVCSSARAASPNVSRPATPTALALPPRAATLANRLNTEPPPREP